MTEVAANWITIEPPHLKHTSLLAASAGTTSISLPASDEPQFAIVFRRQRVRSGGEPKFTAVPSRFSNLTNDFEFAGWGTISQVNLTPDDLSHGKDTWHNFHNQQVLGLFEASALAANDILGGVFYTLPSVFAISGVYSPISLFVAALSLFLWRPVMEELGSALPISGAPYTYLLNVSTKFVALVGAALLLLDFAATAVTSAATAMAYLAGELAIPFPLYVGTLLVFVLFTAVSLAGLRESARVASGVLSFHLLTIIILIIASVVTWAFIGSSQLKANWTAGHAETPPVLVSFQVLIVVPRRSCVRRQDEAGILPKCLTHPSFVCTRFQYHHIHIGFGFSPAWCGESGQRSQRASRQGGRALAADMGSC